MRSYRHYCALARGLDEIGDRWVLLIVRELLPGPRRYSQLLDGLPGIATNLLAERLRSMEARGLIVKGDDDHYALTERGEGLREVVFAIGRWAYPQMGEMAPDESVRTHWATNTIGALFPGKDDTRPELTIEVRCGDDPMTVRSTGGRVSVKWGPASGPDLLVTGPADAIVALFAHRITADESKERGVAITGDPRSLRKLRPRLAATTQP